MSGLPGPSTLLIALVFHKQVTSATIWGDAFQPFHKEFSDGRLVAVKCLQKYGYIGGDYTVEDFDRDRAADSFPFDKYEEQPNNCLFVAGYSYWRLNAPPGGHG